MRKIQTKLNSPSPSTEKLNKTPSTEEETEKVEPEAVERRTYQYSGPPAVNFSTWTERPKSHISIKEDTDYKYKKEKDNINSKIVVNGINHHKDLNEDLNNYTNGFNVRIGYDTDNNYETDVNNKNNNPSISIKVNGTESAHQHHQQYQQQHQQQQPQQPNNGVIIKIGPTQNKEDYVNRFINHTAPVGYRKPLGTINKNEITRPHSIAITNGTDYQPPIVRSVEYKKPYQNGKSVTQISTSNYNYEPRSLNYPLDQTNLNNDYVEQRKPLTRVSSYAQNFGPIVKGFKNIDTKNTWNNYGTLPNKINVKNNEMNVIKRTESNKDIDKYTTSDNNITNRASLFGDVVLRNRQNVFVNNRNVNNRHSVAVFDKTDVTASNPPPPNPPKLPKFNEKTFNVTNSVNDRAQLLEDIRRFGGKKGLRTVKS